MGPAPSKHRDISAKPSHTHETLTQALFLVFFGEYNGFYAQRRAYFTLGIDSPHHGLSNELLYVAIGHFKVILSQTGVCLGPLTTEAAHDSDI